jgi:hypothetical protein
MLQDTSPIGQHSNVNATLATRAVDVLLFVRLSQAAGNCQCYKEHDWLRYPAQSPKVPSLTFVLLHIFTALSKCTSQIRSLASCTRGRKKYLLSSKLPFARGACEALSVNKYHFCPPALVMHKFSSCGLHIER